MKDMTAQQRCFNHRDREAVARCPECRRCFCRECITEHDQRVMCAACIASLANAKVRKPERHLMSPLLLVLQAGIAFILLWFSFYAFGRVLLRIPTEFHGDTLWRSQPWEQP